MINYQLSLVQGQIDQLSTGAAISDFGFADQYIPKVWRLPMHTDRITNPGCQKLILAVLSLQDATAKSSDHKTSMSRVTLLEHEKILKSLINLSFASEYKELLWEKIFGITSDWNVVCWDRPANSDPSNTMQFYAISGVPQQ